MTIRRILVANRGEIARRVFATCRRLGIGTVAVHSDADAGLPFVREADAAVRLPGNVPAETYLRGDLVIEAARRAGADAIHPGYGFLSENAAFARAVLDAGLIWIGPAPESIEQMGSKIESKKLMAAAGVPVLDNLSPETATEADLPLLVKASAGGGGRGMRVVRSLADLTRETALAADEAESAFGDGTVFVERYVEHGRHVEVQVVGDQHGVVRVFGERDCSLQRRHQKVVEEAPAPGLPESTRAALHDAARRAAEAIGYVGAGTVEFLYDADRDRFFFLEMNTRLQVEHPVTELVFGVDLVALQIAVAEGRSSAETAVGATTSALDPRGHAIEVRLYAEDPRRDFEPQTGTLTAFEIPAEDGVRVDAGFEAGNEVSTHYDAMLAKIIAWAPTRELAARKLGGALSRARIHGVTTNRDLLVQLLEHPVFREARMTTTSLEREELARLRTETDDDPGPELVAAAIALAERDRAQRRVQRGIPVAWRNVVSQPQLTRFDGDREIAWWGGREGYRVEGMEVLAASTEAVTLQFDGVARTFQVAIVGEVAEVDSARGHVRLVRQPRFVDPAEQVHAGSLLAPMPGTVIGVPVASGTTVASGDTLIVLEAMKMQHSIKAPTDGVVDLVVQVGQQVSAGDVLAVVSMVEDVAQQPSRNLEGEEE